MDYVQSIPELQPFFSHANHVDIKHVESTNSLREFAAALLSYQPGWITLLFGVRKVFVRFLGMRQAGIPTAPKFTPETLPMNPGQKVNFFTVKLAEEDLYWLLEVPDEHLTAWLAVVVEPLADNHRRFHVVTIVKYHKWSGPVYFNVIRPFHHLVVGSMAHYAARTSIG